MSLFTDYLHISNPAVQKLLLSVGVIVAAVAVTGLLRYLVLRYVEEAEARYRAAKGINRTIAVIALIIIVIVWAPDVTTLVTVLTVLGTGLAIAMREAVLSFVAWTDIIFRRPFEQGDRIEINGVKGDVIDIRMLHTTLMELGNWVNGDQSTGRIMHIPNSWIFRHALQNYSQGFSFIWNEFPVTLTLESDWQAAREIMLELAQESAEIVEEQASKQLRDLSRKYLIHYSLLTPFVYVRIVDNGVRLTLRYLCEVRKRRGTTHAFTLRILEAFAKHEHIEFASPTYGVPTAPGRTLNQEPSDRPTGAGSSSEPSGLVDL